MFAKSQPPPPRVLPIGATLDDVIRVVNDNTARVQSLYSTEASISVPLTPSLRANLAWERPRRLRLRAETSLAGPELDVGSNDQLFWFWVKRMEPPAVLYCRHEQYQQSAAPRMLPVQPDWIPEAIGLVTFEPGAQHSGPYPTREGQLEIRTVRSGPAGAQTKVTVIDAASAWVLQQHLYDERGQLIASSITSQHQSDPASGATLPRRVEIQVPAHRFSMRLDLRSLQINTPGSNAALYELPAYQNANLIDMADPRVISPNTPVTTVAVPAATNRYR